MTGVRQKNLLLAIFFSFIWLQVTAQDVTRPGVISIELVEATETLNNNPVVPPLAENQSIIRFLVDQNPYFTAQDFAGWLRDGAFSIQRVIADPSSASVRPDGSVLLRVEVDFIGTTTTVNRPFQLRHPANHFDTYFSNRTIHKQQVATYRVSIERAPTFSQQFIPRGKIIVLSEQDGAEISIVNNQGARLDQRFTLENINFDLYWSEFELPIGTYSIFARKTGFRDLRINNVEVLANRETAVTAKFETSAPVAPTVTTGLVQLKSNVSDIQIAVGNISTGTSETRIMFGGQLNLPLPPGDYRVMTVDPNYQRFEASFRVEVGDSVERQVDMILPNRASRLDIITTPATAIVEIRGEKNGLITGSTPFTTRNLIRERVTVSIYKEFHKPANIVMDLFTEENYTVRENLPESFIRVSSNPRAEIALNGDRVGASPFQIHNPDNRVHQLTLTREYYETKTIEIDLRNRNTETISENLERKYTNLILENSQYSIPVSSRISSTEFTQRFKKESTIEVRVPQEHNFHFEITRPGFKKTEFTTDLLDYDMRVPYTLVPKSKFGTIFRSTLIPGWGQSNWGHKFRGFVFFSAFAGAAYMGATSILDYQESITTYNDARVAYNNLQSGTPAQYNILAGEMEDAHALMLGFRDDANFYLTIAAGVWGLNLLDRILVRSPKNIIRRSQRASALDRIELNSNLATVQLKYKF